MLCSALRTWDAGTLVLASLENALLVRPEARDELAAAIRRLIENPRLVGALGGKARATYEKNFTIERFGGEFAELIRGAISEKN